MFFVNDPGPWQSFILRGDNVGRSINEVTQKYLNEQLQFENFISMEQQLQLQQYQNKGPLPNNGSSEVNNYITSVNFGGDELTTISGFNDAQIVVTFDRSVEVTGTPYIDASNQQQGLGADSTIRYSYSSGDGTNTLVFVNQQASAVTNTQSDVGAYAIDAFFNSTASSAVNTLAGCTNGTYTVTGTWAAGTVSGDTSGGNVSNIQVTVVSNAITNINFALTTTASGKRFTPGNTLTIQGSLLGAEGSGTYIFTIQTSMLLGDVNGLTGTSITLNGGTITNTEGGSISLAYTETDRKTAIAS
jgi:hypothetical protein